MEKWATDEVLEWLTSLKVSAGSGTVAAAHTPVGETQVGEETLRLVTEHQIDGSVLCVLATDPWVNGLAALRVDSPLLRARIRSTALDAALRVRDDEKSNSAEEALARLTSESPLCRNTSKKQDGQTSAETLQQLRVAAGPVATHIGYIIDHIGHVDVHGAKFFCDFLLLATWQDAALAGCPPELASMLRLTGTRNGMMVRNNGPMEVVDWERAGLFLPELIVTNAHRLQDTSYQLRLADASRGLVHWRKSFHGWLNLEMGNASQHFPFECAELRICIRARTLDRSHVVLKLWPGLHNTPLGGTTAKGESGSNLLVNNKILPIPVSARSSALAIEPAQGSEGAGAESQNCGESEAGSSRREGASEQARRAAVRSGHGWGREWQLVGHKAESQLTKATASVSRTVFSEVCDHQNAESGPSTPVGP
jgi:hypothetical protein